MKELKDLSEVCVSIGEIIDNGVFVVLISQ